MPTTHTGKPCTFLVGPRLLCRPGACCITPGSKVNHKLQTLGNYHPGSGPHSYPTCLRHMGSTSGATNGSQHQRWCIQLAGPECWQCYMRFSSHFMFQGTSCGTIVSPNKILLSSHFMVQGSSCGKHTSWSCGTGRESLPLHMHAHHRPHTPLFAAQDLRRKLARRIVHHCLLRKICLRSVSA